MATVLYITAHPHDHTASFSMAVGKEFIDAYRSSHPQDEVIHLDLYKTDVPSIDTDVFSAWGKLQSGGAFDQLSPEEQRKISTMNQLSDQFVAADKYVFVTPMWNLFFPAVLKTYFDTVCVAGKTFKYTEQGPVGLLTDKKALHIQATGGIYSAGPAKELNVGNEYIDKLLKFLGVPSYETLPVEGMAYKPDQAQNIKEEAIKKAKELAAQF